MEALAEQHQHYRKQNHLGQFTDVEKFVNKITDNEYLTNILKHHRRP